ncbi:MAG: hypothetical protein H0W71_09230 [Sphingomonas sp.]|nr:hypothetical protein [Sphingomonas sp.]
MGAGHNFVKFKAAILELSNSVDWLEAKPEWELHLVYNDSNERACECGHQPINQICVIKNRENKNEAEVGNICVHNFMQLASRRVFSVLRRVRAEITKSLNPAALDLFCRRSVISTIEHDDYLEYWRKRTNLSDEQRAQKLDINQRILDYVDAEAARLIKKFQDFGLKPRTR